MMLARLCVEIINNVSNPEIPMGFSKNLPAGMIFQVTKP